MLYPKMTESRMVFDLNGVLGFLSHGWGGKGRNCADAGTFFLQ